MATKKKTIGVRVEFDSDAKAWLAANGYDDVVKLIEKVERIIKARGVGTRRSWWEVLAGHYDGSPMTKYGITFPVLAAARRREGLTTHPNAIQRSPHELAPVKKAQSRWKGHNKKTRR